MLRHFLLTVSVWDPATDPAANRFRLELTKSTVVPSVRSQRRTDVTWLVATHPGDPLRKERLEAFASSGVRVVEASYSRDLPVSEISEPALVSQLRDPSSRRHLLTGAPGTSTWVEVLDRAGALFDQVLPADIPMLLTRVDDDDAFTPDAFDRLRAAAVDTPTRVCWSFPNGYLVWKARTYAPYSHDSLGFISFQVSPPDRLHPLAIPHNMAKRFAEWRAVDDKPGWMWLRHDANISIFEPGFKRSQVDAGLESQFAVDWPRIRELT